ncbi:hypothetical protein ES332_A06G224000v1 [Gossypium tomentosum]|uniref:Uncharacterized protein n=1 Tax=Gossypium tomentosum TaxID=34277 RepID=A0A5D2Q9U5_GOSTO|nr:hypothetical protein ES332_A06G224000v1 [Gossypium tomentosum]
MFCHFSNIVYVNRNKNTTLYLFSVVGNVGNREVPLCFVGSQNLSFVFECLDSRFGSGKKEGLKKVRFRTSGRRMWWSSAIDEQRPDHRGRKNQRNPTTLSHVFF